MCRKIRRLHVSTNEANAYEVEIAGHQQEGCRKNESTRLITPGKILLEEFMKPSGLTATALSLELRIPADHVQAILKNQRGITANTAVRLSQYFGNSAEFWLNLQKRKSQSA